MINYIWMGLLAIGILVGMFTGNTQAVTDAMIKYAETGVELSIGMIGVMTLWLGIMKIGEEAGLVALIGKLLSPIMKKLFPNIPEDHPASGAIVMNLAANMLGLGNAATPFGIKAMQELQKLNPSKTVATNEMIMFLGINTSSVTIIPASIIALRASAGSKNPTEIIGAAILATTVSTLTAIFVAIFLQNKKKHSFEKYFEEEKKEEQESLNVEKGGN